MISLSIKYLIQDSINETRKLAKFLGRELSDEQIESLVDHCSFDNLKNSPAFQKKPPAMSEQTKEGGDQMLDFTPEQLEMMKAMKEMTLFRKGQIGDWKNYLDIDKWKAIDEMVVAKLEYKKQIRFEPTK